MKYFFILGSNPAISAVEVTSLITGGLFTVTEVYKQAMIVEGGDDLDTRTLMDRLGGTVKIGRIIEEGLEVTDEAVIAGSLALARERKADVGRVTFGLSAYALERSGPASRAATVASRFKRIGMEVKRLLKEEDVPCRFVRPSAGFALSSAAAQKNGLTGPGGFEYVLLTKGDAMMTGVTLAIQPFERFSAADYGRPSRDTVQGMLPPKLARIMLNIAAARPGQRIFDPFCGSGTVLTEALQLGVRQVVGSDTNPGAIESTKENIAWLTEKGFCPAPERLDLSAQDARKAGEWLEPASVDAIVTEPYLGPPRNGKESRGESQRTLYELTRLYVGSLASWKTVLKEGAPVVMALPVYIHGLERHGVNAEEFRAAGFETESLFPSRFLERMGVRETKNKGLLYGRMDQKVWREIVRLRTT